MANQANYDDETLSIIRQASMRMARDHGMLDDDDTKSENPMADFMREQNRALDEAAAAIGNDGMGGVVKKKKGIVKQKVIKPVRGIPNAAQVSELPAHEHKNVLLDVPVANEPVIEPASVQEDPVVEQVAVVSEPEPSVEQPQPIKQKTLPKQKVADTPYDSAAPAVEYDAFVEITGLPSKGLFYPNKIYGQSIKLIDMFLINTVDQSNFMDVFDEIFRRRVRGIEPEDIMSCDEAYILQWLRASSFPNRNMKVGGYTCTNEKCNFTMNDAEYAVNFRNLEFTTDNDIEQVAEKLADGSISFTLSDGTPCEIYPRRRSHDRIVADWEYSFLKNGGNHKLLKAYSAAISTATIVEIGGCDGLEEKFRFISELNRTDSHLFYDVLNSVSITTETYIKHVCSHCGTEVRAPFPFRIDEYISGL